MFLQKMKRVLWVTGLCVASQAQAIYYTYDNLGRLTDVAYDNGDTLHYSYDFAGNITSMQSQATDSDRDGIPDSVELSLGLDPYNSPDASGDLDGDGKTNLEEYLAGTNPKINENLGNSPEPRVFSSKSQKPGSMLLKILPSLAKPIP